jgi:hypothetical protein
MHTIFKSEKGEKEKTTAVEMGVSYIGAEMGAEMGVSYIGTKKK